MSELHGPGMAVRDNDLHEPDPYRAAPDSSTAPPWPPTDVPLMDDDYWAQLPNPLTLQAIALIVRMSETTVLRRLQDGTIPGHFIGRSWIVFQGEFRAWLASRRNTPSAETVTSDPLATYEDQLGMAELMELFGKTKQTIRKWLTDEQIPGYQVSGRWTVHKSELRETLLASSNQRTTA